MPYNGTKWYWAHSDNLLEGSVLVGFKYKLKFISFNGLDSTTMVDLLGLTCSKSMGWISTWVASVESGLLVMSIISPKHDKESLSCLGCPRDPIINN